MPPSRPTVIERAFELAASGKFNKLSDLRRTLAREGYRAVDAETAGRQIVTQLLALMRAPKRADEGRVPKRKT